MQDILHLLQHRRSNKQFGDIAPNAEQLENMLKAALRAPDHKRLKPYHFVVIEKSGMAKFQQCLAQAADQFDLEARKVEKLANQAPMVIGVVAKINHQEKKAPEWEQTITAGCATYALQLAANAQGFDTVWITNKWVEGDAIREAFGCTESDKIVALLFVGSPKDDESVSQAREPESTDGFVSYIR